MNRFNERYADLIYYLFNKNTWCSLGEISEKTGFSRSTIWRDITFLNSGLPPGWCIEKNESHGARLLKAPGGTLEDIWAYMKRENSYFQTLEFILYNNGVSITEIAEEIHISRSTVYRQLDKIQQVVEAAGLQLTTSPYKLVGEEKKVRRFIMQYLDFRGIDFQRDLIHFEIEEFQSTLLQLTSDYSFSLHLGALQRLALIMHIINIRILQGFNVELPNQLLEDNQDTHYFEVAKNMFRFMANCQTREQQIQEILFFSIFLMSEEKPLNRTVELSKVRSHWKSNTNDSLLLFLSKLSYHLNFDISQDDQFLYKFISTIKRTRFDTQFETDTRINTVLPFLPYVETNPLFKTIEKLIKENLETPLLYFGKIEILELFLLVQAALLRKKNNTPIMTALICRTYIELDYISELLVYHFGNQLNMSFLDITDVEILQRHNEFDLVIGTEKGNYSIDHIPVLKVSTFPTVAELAEIKRFINQYFLNRWALERDYIYPFQEELLYNESLRFKQK